MNKREKGQKGEDIALEYIMKKKINIIARNFKSHFGEIDFIGADNNHVIFYEVKYRNNDLFGEIEETINDEKLKRIKKTAEYFLMKNPELLNKELQFNAILIRNDNNCLNIKEIKNLIFKDKLNDGFL